MPLLTGEAGGIVVIPQIIAAVLYMFSCTLKPQSRAAPRAADSCRICKGLASSVAAHVDSPENSVLSACGGHRQRGREKGIAPISRPCGPPVLHNMQSGLISLPVFQTVCHVPVADGRPGFPRITAVIAVQILQN